MRLIKTDDGHYLNADCVASLAPGGPGSDRGKDWTFVRYLGGGVEWIHHDIVDLATRLQTRL